MILYGPWRRRFDRRQVAVPEPVDFEEPEKSMENKVRDIGGANDVEPEKMISQSDSKEIV